MIPGGIPVLQISVSEKDAVFAGRANAVHPVNGSSFNKRNRCLSDSILSFFLSLCSYKCCCNLVNRRQEGDMHFHTPC